LLDIISITMIIVYLTLLIIPLIYNNRTVKSRQISSRQSYTSRQDNIPKYLGKSVIILLNNVSDEQLNRIIKLTNMSDKDKG
jgi:hypothetical protein